jgi:hypothetical protein
MIAWPPPIFRSSFEPSTLDAGYKQSLFHR